MSSRRSFALSPKKGQGFVNDRRQSFSNGSPLFDIGQNNDEAEKKARQLNRLQQLQSKATVSPATSNADRRKSINPVANFTNQQLAEHYTTCIQLSAENKINVKNAFNLQLIDYMTEMLNRKDSEMNNFQVASFTLDASTKIYAYRVDSIHTDTLKMAGGLGRTKESNEAPGDVEAIEGAKGRKKKKRSATIETNLKNLDVGQFDIEFDVDPLFFKMASQFDEGQSGGNSFLNSLPVLDDTCKLVLDSDTLMTSLENENSIIKISIPLFNNLEYDISPTFVSFEFKNVDADTSLCPTKKQLMLDNELKFDVNAIPEPLDMDYNDIDMNDDAPPLCLDEEVDENMVTATEVEACKDGTLARNHKMEITDLKEHLTIIPLEYSYFDSKILSAWAGAAHWNLKPNFRDFNKLQEKIKGKKKKELFIDYVESPDIGSYFEHLLRRSTKLTQNTIKKWTTENTTLPVDLHYNPSKLSRLYLRENMVVRIMNSVAQVHNLDDSIANYDNENDQQNYCPDGIADYVDIEPCDDTGGFSQTMGAINFPQTQDGTGADFFGDNLVSAPNKVAKINIGYAKTAKIIDMKKLKSTLWNILTHPVADKENRSSNANKTTTEEIYMENMDSNYNLKFSEVYSDLGPKLSSKMADNLSLPLAFVALLHLANEHNLKLYSLEELGDFIVSQD